MTPSKPKQADDFIRIQDLFYLCLAKWRWFVVSLPFQRCQFDFRRYGTLPGKYQRQ